jgi:hypothetical protein
MVEYHGNATTTTTTNMDDGDGDGGTIASCSSNRYLSAVSYSREMAQLVKGELMCGNPRSKTPHDKRARRVPPVRLPSFRNGNGPDRSQVKPDIDFGS